VWILSAWRPCCRKDSTSTARVFCRKRHVCAGLRGLAARRSAKIRRTFLMPLRYLPPNGRADRGKTQNPNSRIRKFKNCKIAKITLIAIFSARSIAKLFPRKIVSLFSRSAARLSLLRLLPHHWQCARRMPNASKQCPYEAINAMSLLMNPERPTTCRYDMSWPMWWRMSCWSRC
jgi:hypothetical protein